MTTKSKISETERLFRKKIDIIYNEADKFYERGKYRQSARLFKKVIQLCARKYNKRSDIYMDYVPDCYNVLGLISSYTKNYKEAIQYLRKGLENTGLNKEAKIDCLADIGIIYQLMGDYQKSSKYLRKGLNLARKIKDKIGENTVCWYIGKTNLFLGKNKKALKIFKNTKQCGEDKVSSYIDTGRAYYQMAEEGLDRELNYNLAYRMFKKAHKIAVKKPYPYLIAYSLYPIGLIEERRGNYKKAIRFYREGLKKARQSRDNEVIADCELGLGSTILFANQNEQEGIKHTMRAINLFKERGDRIGLAYTFGVIGEYMLRKRRYKEAYRSFKECVDIYYRIKSKVPKTSRSSASRPNIRYYTALIKASHYLGNRTEMVRTARRIADIFA